MKYLIIDDSVIQPYLGGAGAEDPNLACNEMYSLYNIVCVEISDMMYNTLRPTWWGKATEIDAETAKWGCSFFSEIREVAKIYEAESPGYPAVKTPVELTPEIIDHILLFMKRFAKEIIETEYERRFLEMRDTSMLEAESWEIQKHEAREYLSNPETSYTPFLDYIAIERNFDKEVLANKILEKAEEYADRLSEMLVKAQKIMKEFESCTTVWDINILYDKYLGILMPTTQAMQMGLTVSDTDWTRTDDPKVYEFNF